MSHLVQLQHPALGRAVARVDDRRLRLCNGPASVYQLAQMALDAGSSLEDALDRATGDSVLDYDAVHAGRSDWRLLPPIDHPAEPARALLTRTGPTPLRAAQR